MIKDVIFDVDGVLIQTDMEYPAGNVKLTIEETGDGIYRREKVPLFWWGGNGISRSDILRRFFQVKDVDRFWRIYNVYASDFEDAKNYKNLYSDVRQALSLLLNAGVELGIVTDAPSNIALPQLEYFLDVDCFSGIITVSDLERFSRSKPNPDGLLLCMERMKVEDAVYVEDSTNGILAAQRAGIDAIWMDRDEHEISVEPDRRITSMYELLMDYDTE